MDSSILHQMEKAQHGARLLDELDILNYKSNNSRQPESRRGVFCHWKGKVLRFIDEMRRRSIVQCVVCLQVHQINGLPSAMNGRALVVGWKTKGCKGEHTLPVHVREGVAAFEEIFLHYCSTDVVSILKGFTIWVSLVDAADCDLGTFHVDLSELGEVKNLNSNFGGKDMSFVLGGVAHGGSLSLSFYCRITDEESSDQIGKKQGQRWCFSCLPNLGCLRSRPLTFSARRIPSLRSDNGFITIENSIRDRPPENEEDGGFITVEKEAVISTQSITTPPSDHLVNTDDDESGDPEEEKPCLVMELKEDELELEDEDKVEDEFLRMIEDKHWKARDGGEPWKKGFESRLSLSMDLSMNVDLDSLIKEAEDELAKAAEVWKNRVRGVEMEKEEFEELRMTLRSNEIESSSSCCSWLDPV